MLPGHCELFNSINRSARRANHRFSCLALFAKIFRFAPDPNQFTDSRRPVPREGRCARHQRGAGRKTIARGMPGDFRRDRGDYARMLILFCMRGCGRGGRLAFPAPSVLKRREPFMHRSGASRRGNAEPYPDNRRHCEQRKRRSNPSPICSASYGLLRGACHRARIRATRWLAMTSQHPLRLGCLKMESGVATIHVVPDKRAQRARAGTHNHGCACCAKLGPQFCL